MPQLNTPPESPPLFDEIIVDDDMFDMILIPRNDPALDDVSDDSENDGGEENERVVWPAPERDDACYEMQLHDDSVLSCAIHPLDFNVIATGGTDNLLLVMDIKENNILLKYNDFTESVEFLAFSHDGKYLAGGDLNGIIIVFETTQYSLVHRTELSASCSWVLWHFAAPVLMASAVDGLTSMYKVPSGDCKIVATLEPAVTSAAKLFADGRRLAQGQNGSLYIIDLKNATILQTIKPTGFGIFTILCLDIHSDSNSIVCGCDTGMIFSANANNGSFVSLTPPNERSSEIETIKYSRDNSMVLFATGSNNGTLTVWDHTRKVIRYTHKFEATVVQMVWHPTKPLVFTCHADYRVRVFDARAGLVLKELQGHNDCCLAIDLSSDGKLLVTGSDDKSARVYNVDNLDV